MEQMKKMPLEGIRVVELATVVAAPTASRVLCAFGAEVIKVETKIGDEMRRAGEFEMVVCEDDKNPLFTIQNSGKRLTSIDLKNPDGKAAFLRLLETADVFLTNVRLPSLGRLGLDYETLHKAYPGLVYAHFSGFGPKGPDAAKPGFDSTAFWLRSGPMADWQVPGSFPFTPTYAFGDMATSSAFLSGILMAIIAVVIFIAAFKAVGWSFADVNTQLSAIDPNLVQPFNESGLYSLSGVIAMPFYLFVSLVANPYCTIRLMAMTNVGRKSFKKFGLTLISVGMICMLMYMSGLFGWVLYPNLADADSVIPTIAQNLLPEWGLAIVAVGLFASMMACVDSMIHCISAMLSVDIYKRALAAAVLAVIVTVAVSLFTKPVDPAVLNRMKGLKAEG